jgi:hypothetical protein
VRDHAAGGGVGERRPGRRRRGSAGDRDDCHRQLAGEQRPGALELGRRRFFVDQHDHRRRPRPLAGLEVAPGQPRQRLGRGARLRRTIELEPRPPQQARLTESARGRRGRQALRERERRLGSDRRRHREGVVGEAARPVERGAAADHEQEGRARAGQLGESARELDQPPQVRDVHRARLDCRGEPLGQLGEAVAAVTQRIEATGERVEIAGGQRACELVAHRAGDLRRQRGGLGRGRRAARGEVEGEQRERLPDCEPRRRARRRGVGATGRRRGTAEQRAGERSQAVLAAGVLDGRGCGRRQLD